MDRVVPPADITPQEFFTRWVPRSVAEDAQRRERLTGTEAILEFDLQGADGGVYHITVVEGRVEGRTGRAEIADLRIRLDVATWRALNAGSINALEALVKRRLKLDGNLGLAVKLHLILG